MLGLQDLGHLLCLVLPKTLWDKVGPTGLGVLGHSRVGLTYGGFCGDLHISVFLGSI